MKAAAETADGVFAVDLETGEVEPAGDLAARAPVPTPLPRVLDTDASGSTVIAVVDAKPPLMVSYDAGTTWAQAGRGLPPGRAVALSADDPDLVLYGARNRLYLSRDGGRFWTAIDAELPPIERVELRES
jgi:photosystem II stability/assembly factor-like uncharacterized protein